MKGSTIFVANSGISLARNIPVTSMTKGQYTEYLKDSNTNNIRIFSLSPTTQYEINKIINEFKTSNSSGYDGIYTK